MTHKRSRSRRVAVVLHDEDIGGATRSVLNIVPSLCELGWEFTFWAPAGGRPADELAERQWRVAGAPRQLRYSLAALRVPPGPVRRLSTVPRYLARFRAWLQAERPSLVHGNTVIVLPELLAAAGAGAARVLHVHETLEPNLQGAIASRLITPASDLIVSASEIATKTLGRQRRPVRVVPNGVPVETSPLAASLNGRPLTVGTLGTVSATKGSDVFVAAARRIGLRRPDVEFRMMGAPASGRDRAWANNVLASAREAGIRCDVTHDVPAELASWDVFVLPSRRDAFPLAVLEAMAAGLPAVVTRVGGIPEQVTRDTAVLVPPADPDALADAILRLLEDPSSRAAMGAAARARVAANFSVERQAEGMDAAYRAALDVR